MRRMWAKSGRDARGKVGIWRGKTFHSRHALKQFRQADGLEFASRCLGARHHGAGSRRAEHFAGASRSKKRLAGDPAGRTPSLRIIARTGPYMHDGRFATLEEVNEHDSSPPVRSATLDPNLAKHPQGLGPDEP